MVGKLTTLLESPNQERPSERRSIQEYWHYHFNNFGDSVVNREKGQTRGDSSSLYSTVIRNGYDVGSGVLAAVNDQVRIQLSNFGQFASVYDPNAPEIDDQALQAVSAMAESKIADETILAERLFGDKANVRRDPTIGFYLDLFAGHVSEGNYRRDGSSGGFGSWILCEMLKTDMVDCVINVRPTFTPDDLLFKYGVSTTEQEVQAGAGSRYYPVELSTILQTVRSTPGRYAVVGIPSVLMELRLLAEADPVIHSRIRYTIGLICGHQKSTKYVESLAWQCGIKPGNLIYFNFRKKTGTAPASIYHMEMVGNVDGQQVTISKSEFELFGSNWGHGFFKAKFSDFTDDSLNETADVSIGDAWLPEYVNDSDGSNVVIIRDEGILERVQKAIDERRLNFDRISAETVVRSQSGLIHHTRDEIGYRLARQDKRGEWRPTKRIVASIDLPFLRRAIQDTREIIANLSHIHYEEAVARDDWMYFENKMRPYVARYKRLYTLLALRNNEITFSRLSRQIIGRTARLRRRG